MTQTIKTLTIEQLAQKLNGKLWVKGDIKRIYLDEGYNTKKMSTKTYVYEKDATFHVVCDVDCPSQDPAWILSQEESVIKYVTERISNIIDEYGVEIKNPEIAIQASLDAEEQVQGYYMQWKEVRVPINSYGKLAYRKRMFVVTYNGPKSKAPYKLIELTDEEFALATEAERKERAYEYGNEPNFKITSNANQNS